MNYEWICKRPQDPHPSVRKGYKIKFRFDGTYAVQKDDRVVKDGFTSEAAARHWADEFALGTDNRTDRRRSVSQPGAVKLRV